MDALHNVTQAFEAIDRGVKPVTWSVDLEECAKEYFAFAKELDNCQEMGDTVDVTNAIKRYVKFMMLQNRHSDILLVPPFDVKVIWLAHMIRVDAAAFGRVIDSHVLEATFRTRASLPQTQELWKAAYGAELKFEYQPSARRVNIPVKVLDNKNFNPTIVVKDIVADRKWLPLLESSLRNFSFTDTMVANAKKAYDMYMYLLYKEPNCDLGPPASVDLIWHSHMCNPGRYETDCNRLLGKVILHSPWPAEGGTVERVETMFAREYGTAMSEVVAGLSDVSVNAVAQTKGAPIISPASPKNPPPLSPGPMHLPDMCFVKAPQDYPKKMCEVAEPQVAPQPQIFVTSCSIAVPRDHPLRTCKQANIRSPVVNTSPVNRPPACSIAPPHIPPAGKNVQQCVRDGVCTFVATGDKFQNQTYYQCRTCGYGEGTGMCASCLTKCHRNHDVTVATTGDCYCDCGAGQAPGVCCQAIQIGGRMPDYAAPSIVNRPPAAR